MPLFLGLDVGTQSCKCVVWDSQKKNVIASGQRAYGVLSERPGQAEQDPKTWLKAVEESALQALETVDKGDVAAMAVSGQQHGMVALDASASVIRNAKLWCDVESAPQAEAITTQLGYKVVPGFTATKVLWLAENEPENWERTKNVLLPSQYINFYLTGNMAMECGDASGTGLFDIHNRTHAHGAIKQVLGEGAADIFPPLIEPTAVVGKVKQDIAELLGIPKSTIVAAGSGDNMMSALGVGAVEDGDLVVSLGTSGTLFCPSEKPIMDVEGRIAPFCDSTGKWLPLMCTMNCTGCPEEVQNAFSLSLKEATDLAAQEPPGCEGVNILPYFMGERTPDWPHSRGSILGLTPGMLQRPGLLYRSALEGSTFSLATGIALLEEFGVSTTSVRLVGGGSKNLLWRQIVADVLNKPVIIPKVAESAAVGAALQAAAVFFGAEIDAFVKENGAGAEPGVVEPEARNRESYGEALARHNAAGEALFGQPLGRSA